MATILQKFRNILDSEGGEERKGVRRWTRLVVTAIIPDDMSVTPKLVVVLSQEQIAAGVKRLAAEITKDYHGKELLLVGILKGSFMFLADLIRQLDLPLEVDFICLSSYGCSTDSSGKIKVAQPLRAKVRGRHVLVVEDIVDTGLTVAFFLDYLRKKQPASVKLCALTDKLPRRRVPVTIDYLGFNVPDRFLVGYGLDLNEKFRNLPDICYVEV